MSGIKALCDNLLDQARDKERLANGEPDSIFMLDAKVLRAAAELLKAAPEWISVKDKMPETNNKDDHTYEVLVYIPKREGYTQHGIYIGKPKFIKGSDGSDNFWGIRRQDCDWLVRAWSYFEQPIVTHWMPLPQQPQKEDAP